MGCKKNKMYGEMRKIPFLIHSTFPTSTFGRQQAQKKENRFLHKEYSPKLSENPYCYEDYVNNKWCIVRYMLSIFNFACKYDIQPENVSFIIKWCPEDKPIRIYTTATAANMNLVPGGFFYFDDYWNDIKNDEKTLAFLKKRYYTEDEVAKIDAFAEKCAANRNNTN